MSGSIINKAFEKDLTGLMWEYGLRAKRIEYSFVAAESGNMIWNFKIEAVEESEENHEPPALKPPELEARKLKVEKSPDS